MAKSRKSLKRSSRRSRRVRRNRSRKQRGGAPEVRRFASLAELRKFLKDNRSWAGRMQAVGGELGDAVTDDKISSEMRENGPTNDTDSMALTKYKEGEIKGNFAVTDANIGALTFYFL